MKHSTRLSYLMVLSWRIRRPEKKAYGHGLLRGRHNPYLVKRHSNKAIPIKTQGAGFIQFSINQHDLFNLKITVMEITARLIADANVNTLKDERQVVNFTVAISCMAKASQQTLIAQQPSPQML
jgi:hypothetical protein